MITGTALYIVTAVLAFALGIAASLLCLHIRELSELKDQQDKNQSQNQNQETKGS